jgi:putative aldouronate transport system substrate-binding protein
MKKTVVVLFAAFIAAGLWAGGQKQDTSQAGAGASDDGSKTLEITWIGFNPAGIKPIDNSANQQLFEKRFNIKIKNVPVDLYNAEEKNLLIASATDFDIWTFGVPDVKTMTDAGLIRQIPEEYVTKYAPEFVRVLQDGSPYWKYLGTVDGALYAVPMYAQGYRSPWALTVRTDWMKNVGVTAIPKTLDELESLLLKFRENDPDKNGRKDTYGLEQGYGAAEIQAVNPYIFGAYGVNVNRWGGDVNKYWAIQDEYKQALAKIHDWYTKEIYDPEIPVSTRAENWERFAAGKAAGYFGTDWVIEPWGASVGWDLLLKNRPDLDPKTMFTHIPPVTGPNGKAATLQYANPVTGLAFIFGRKTSDEKVIRLLTMLNTILSDRDLYQTMMYGVKGQHFDLTADGNAVQRPQYATLEGQAELGLQRFFPHQFAPMEMTQIRYTAAGWHAWQTIIGYNVLENSLLGSVITDADKEYSAAVQTIEREFFWKTVTGEWDINSTWNSYVSRWLAAGGQKILDAKKALAKQMGM